ncbi:MAG: hypothetical protein HFH26_12120 [Clostridiaceae bacterium]|nr:hypothetical protein [Clostridiaceae bacterium]
MRQFLKKNKDERIQSEINSIYRMGYHVLMFGILIDLIVQFADNKLSGNSWTSVRPLEFGTFMAANILCLILMIYKGIGDDDTRFAETEHFPHAYYLRRSFAISLISSVIFGALKAWQLHPEVQSDLSLIIFIFCISIFLSTGILIYGLQYLCFRIAKKRRNKIADTFNHDDS